MYPRLTQASAPGLLIENDGHVKGNPLRARFFIGKKMIDRSDMAARGRIGGYEKASRYPADELTREARAGFMERFMPTDPDLSEEERQRRAQASLRAHMARLARLSALARRKK